MTETTVTIDKAPADYGLKHTEWRPNQREAIEWVLGRQQTAIMSAVTGSGKTSFARALGQEKRTITLVRTRLLQKENYAEGYDFLPLYGRANYDCVHPDADDGLKADNCMYAEVGMMRCGHGQRAQQMVTPPAPTADAEDLSGFEPCPYVLAREQAKKGRRATLNYAYWFNVYERWPAPQILVCDEAHQLSDLVLEWAGVTISEDRRIKWGLAPFPMIRGNGGILTQQTPATDRAVGWLNQSLATLRTLMAQLSSAAEYDEKARKQAQDCELLGKKLRATLDALQAAPDDWYIKSGPGVKDGRPAFIARPLTARHHFKRYFMNDQWRLVIMSATIGDPAVFAAELGIADYDYLSIPSQFPAQQRPVLALDVPRMGHNSSDNEWNKQADEIAKAIKDCPGNWSGIIHTSSAAEAPKLADRLARRGLQDRVWVANRGMSTEHVADAWHEQARRKPGSININWAMWEGYDPDPSINLKICIVAKVPYAPLNDEYEIARRSYDGKMYLQRAAYNMEQGLGRSRRGRRQDYDIDGQRNGLVAIADNSWRWIKGYFSESIRESIVDMREGK